MLGVLCALVIGVLLYFMARVEVEKPERCNNCAACYQGLPFARFRRPTLTALAPPCSWPFRRIWAAIHSIDRIRWHPTPRGSCVASTVHIHLQAHGYNEHMRCGGIDVSSASGCSACVLPGQQRLARSHEVLKAPSVSPMWTLWPPVRRSRDGLTFVGFHVLAGEVWESVRRHENK